MQSRNDILTELGQVSPFLAGIPFRKDLYPVPAGYFESFADLVVLRIKVGQDNSLLGEMGSFSPLASQVGKVMLFDVPADYFARFPQEMMARIKASEAGSSTEELEILSPLLSGISRKTPFALPTGYFFELPDNLVVGMQAVEFVKEELEEMSPVLAGLKEKTTYQVPEGYFEALPAKILEHLPFRQQPAKLVAFPSFKKSWLKYAVAAGFIGLIVTLGLLQFNHEPARFEDPIASLTKVSDQEMTSYLDNQDIPLPKSLDSNTINSILATSGVNDINDADIQDLMGDVSDSELQQYAYEDLRPSDLKTN
jgi:hypothetical protein